MVITADSVARMARIAAGNDAAVAAPLAQLEPRLEPRAVPLAGGQVVLLGPGM